MTATAERIAPRSTARRDDSRSRAEFFALAGLGAH